MRDDMTFGKTAALAERIIPPSLVPGSLIHMHVATGKGRIVLASMVAARLEADGGADAGPAVVIVPTGAVAPQWARQGLQGVTMLQALRSIAKDGTLAGHQAASVRLVILDEASYYDRAHVAGLRRMLPRAAILALVDHRHLPPVNAGRTLAGGPARGLPAMKPVPVPGFS